MSDPGAGDLGGHTMEQLADYVDRGRQPLDPGIEGSASCRAAIAALERLRTVSATVLGGSAPDEAWLDEAWLSGLMAQISVDARAGADFPLLTTDAGDEVVMTEGALRALVRGAGDEQPGFLAGRVRFEGDLADPARPLTVDLDVVVGYGVVLPAGVALLRAAILDRLHRHTRFRDVRVDVTVRDLVLPQGAR